MDICLSHETALRWLLGNPNPLANGTGHRCSSRLPSSAPPRSLGLALAETLGLKSEAPLDILLRVRSRLPSSPVFTGHLRLHDLPSGSLIALDKGIAEVAIASPELVFVQMAANNTLVDTIAIGCALCSSYRFEGDNQNLVLRKAPDAPLTTRTQLASYVARMEVSPGAARARRALPYILDNAYSPMESGIALCLTLPLRLGGFNLGQAELNAQVNVRTDMGAFETRRPDVIITAARQNGIKTRAAFDYDSDAYHLSSIAYARDAVRRNELHSSLGIPYFTLTTRQATDFVAFSKFADTLRRVLGLRRMDFARGEKNDRVRIEAIHHRQFELWKHLVSPASVIIGKQRE